MAFALQSLETFTSAGPSASGTPPTGFSFANTDTAQLKHRWVGPKLTGDTSIGRSAIVNQQDFELSKTSSGGFCLFFWVMLNEKSRSQDVSHQQTHMYISEVFNQYSEGGPALRFNPSTEKFEGILRSWKSDFSEQIITSTPLDVGYNRWVMFMLTSDNAGNTRWYYKLPGQSLTLWVEDPSTQLAFGKTITKVTVRNGGYSGGVSRRWAGRLGGLGYATISSVSDITIPSTLVDPPTGHNTWYVKRTATGTGDGLTHDTAWSVDQMIDELSNCTIIPSSNPWVYAKTGLTVPMSIDVSDFDIGYKLGEIIHRNGDTILIDDEYDTIRCGTKFYVPLGCEGLKIAPYRKNSRVSFNFSKVASNWTYLGGNIYRIPYAATMGSLWEDSIWLNKVSASSNIVSSISGLSTTSYGFDGTYMYLKLPDGTNPNTNQRVYEYGLGSGISIDAASCFVKDINTTKCAKFNNANNAQSANYPFMFSYNGLNVIDNITATYGDKHCFGAAATCWYPSGSRTVLHNIVAEHGAPASLVGFGGQTAGVFFVGKQNSSNYDNQIIWDGYYSIKNAGYIGSPSGISDSTQPSWYSHVDDDGYGNTFTKVVMTNFYSPNSAVESSSVSDDPWYITPDVLSTWGSSTSIVTGPTNGYAITTDIYKVGPDRKPGIHFSKIDRTKSENLSGSTIVRPASSVADAKDNKNVTVGSKITGISMKPASKSDTKDVDSTNFDRSKAKIVGFDEDGTPMLVTPRASGTFGSDIVPNSVGSVSYLIGGKPVKKTQ